MESSKTTHYNCSEFIERKPGYEVVVSGKWRVHDGRRQRARRLLKKLIFVNFGTFLFSLVFLIYVLAICVNSKSWSSLNEVVDKIKFLEDRVAFVEHIVDISRTDDMLQRRERSVEPNFLDGENRDTKRNQSKTDTRAVRFISSNPGLFAIRPLQGVIGPWDEEPGNLLNMDSLGLKLVENDRKVQMSRPGAYFIYSQVTYPSTNNSNSYSINMISAKDKKNTPISVCSAPGDLLPYSEVSCYTSVVQTLAPGDIIYLQQIEQNRNINMEHSSTYFGVFPCDETIISPYFLGTLIYLVLIDLIILYCYSFPETLLK